MSTTMVKLIEGMQFTGQGESKHEVHMDASQKFGGTDSAARPLEVMLCALGGCTGMDVVSILRKMKTEPRSLQIEITDDQASDYPKVFTKLHLTYRVTGAVPQDNLQKAIDLSLSKYCPITNTLVGVVEITSEGVVASDR